MCTAKKGRLEDAPRENQMQGQRALGIGWIAAGF